MFFLYSSIDVIRKVITIDRHYMSRFLVLSEWNDPLTGIRSVSQKEAEWRTMCQIETERGTACSE